MQFWSRGNGKVLGTAWAEPVAAAALLLVVPKDARVDVWVFLQSTTWHGPTPTVCAAIPRLRWGQESSCCWLCGTRAPARVLSWGRGCPAPQRSESTGSRTIPRGCPLLVTYSKVFFKCLLTHLSNLAVEIPPSFSSTWSRGISFFLFRAKFQLLELFERFLILLEWNGGSFLCESLNILIKCKCLIALAADVFLEKLTLL